MANSAATRVLDLAWRQVDRDNNPGLFIFADDLPLLLEAIDSILKKTLLNQTGQRIIKDFSRSDPTRRIYKNDFSSLFEKLVGVSFESAVDVVGFNGGQNDLKFNVAKKSSFNRDPFSDDSIGAAIPDFRTEYKKSERLNGVQDDEILYRDKIIENLENKQALLQKNECKIQELKTQNSSLEEDVLYRDNIILSKQNEIDSNLDRINVLEQKISQLQKEINIYKSRDASNSLNSQEQKQQFNKELLNRVKSQQAIIQSLQKALNEKKEIIVTKRVPVPFKLTAAQQFEVPNALKLIKYPLFGIALLILIIISVNSSEWKKTIVENAMNNNDIDYDYYNLGDMESDFLI
jgi:hypothetical protein